MKYRIMKNERGVYRIKVKKWYGWSWMADEDGNICWTSSYNSAEELVTEAIDAPELEAMRHRWHVVKEME